MITIHQSWRSVSRCFCGCGPLPLFCHCHAPFCIRPMLFVKVRLGICKIHYCLLVNPKNKQGHNYNETTQSWKDWYHNIIIISSYLCLFKSSQQLYEFIAFIAFWLPLHSPASPLKTGQLQLFPLAAWSTSLAYCGGLDTAMDPLGAA